MLICLTVFDSVQHSFACQQDANEQEDFFERSIEDLMEMEASVASRKKSIERGN